MSEQPRSGGLLRRRTMLTVVGLLLAVGAIALGVYRWRDRGPAPGRSFSLIYPRYDTLIATVNATGQIEPAQVVTLGFSNPGRVSEVLVRIGDAVAQGDVLAQLDTRDLKLRVVQAEAALAQAQASYDKTAAGATQAEVAAAEAQVQQASGQLRQAQGGVTASDLRAAEAQLAQAQAQLAKLEGGPASADLRATEAQLTQAQANLQSQRDSLSAAKTRAESQLAQAANTLRDRQADYTRIYWDNRRLEQQLARFGQELPQQNKDQEEAALRAEQNAEEGLKQAQVAYDQAQQAEVNGVAAAEAQVASAQANLDKLRSGAETDQLAAARAQVASAQANLDKLRGDQRSGALQAAQASVAQAQANLEQIKRGPQPSDLAMAQAQVASAQAALDLARLELDQATLTAPFGGVVAEVNLRVGEVPSQTEAPLVLADLSSYHVDVTVDEIDISRLTAGQPVTLTLDALPGLALPGMVETIAPLATGNTTVTSYQVRVTTTAKDLRVRSGMSANADIVVARKPNVLMAPRRAVRNDRGRLVVDVPLDQSICTLPPDQRPPTVDLAPRSVTTGLSNDQAIEITSGLDERTCVYVEGIDARMNVLFGPPGGRNRN